MRYALVSGMRVEPEYSGQKGACPFCESAVTARCGDILVDHWAHVDKSDCIGCSSPMTDWHRKWQDEFPVDCQERRIGVHRADVLVDDVVIEFQHSSLSGPHIKAREEAYKRMVWILDATETNPEFSNGRWQCYTSTLWRYYVLCKNPVFLDFGKIGVCKIVAFERHGASPSGTGVIYTRAELVANLRDKEWVKGLKPIQKDNQRKAKERQRLEGKRVWRDGEVGTQCASGLSPVPADTHLAKPLVKVKESCGCVFNRQWVANADPHRYGWEKVFCGRCKKWLGNRPIEQTTVMKEASKWRG